MYFCGHIWNYYPLFNHFLNPPVHAKIEEDKIVFKSNEKVQIFNIKNIEYFEDSEIELAANGFR